MRQLPLKLRLERLERLRLGHSGQPYHAVLFQDAAVGRLLGIVFDEPRYAAVLDLDRLLRGELTLQTEFGRDAGYEMALRMAIERDTRRFES